ncbi:hypothetical protein CC1G_11595 [Coprinopsis cinerea okayama7|uniref:Uncharacterized protein n=1 Tax=Coprinopsis cinerea (strain Okayama-7 / 130 / ATCC MYA-4618 / FGSC 9003) TaxID=240176 RepID=A8NMM1_COPC7|nr:hypothetical protein CC1G_11595 [Coprinopsis cinerea okayama7\|eukprot:XP_001834946.1 hypothetical protein CC1G_11595 [Coprinopsis cinerea okayama7\
MASQANIVSLPSLSSSLHSLPQATSLSSLPIHPSMYAQRAAESEAKLQRALSKQASMPQQAQQPPMIPGYNVSGQQQQAYDPSSPLMMRKKKFST